MPEDREFTDFLRWFINTYGYGAAGDFAPSNFRQSQYYARFKAEGAPQWQPKQAPRPSSSVTMPQGWITQPPVYSTGQEFANWYGQAYPDIPPGLYNEEQFGFTGAWPGMGMGANAGGQQEPTAEPSPDGGGGQQFYSPTPAGGRGDMQWEFAPPKFDDVGNVIFPGGYYQVPLDRMQQQQFARQDAQAMAAYNAQAQQAQAQMFQNERQNEIAQQRMRQEQEQIKAQQEIEKQRYLAQLASQPQSWLEYNAAAGKTPTIQKWMEGLMPSGYAIPAPGGFANDYAPSYVGAGEIKAGLPIPGFAPRQYGGGGQYVAREPAANPQQWWPRGESEEHPFTTTPFMSQPGYVNAFRSTPAGGIPDYTKLPELKGLTQQYWQGMGPTAQSQYLAYQQARTGAPASETYWRLPWIAEERQKQERRTELQKWLPSKGMALSYR